VKHGRPDRLGCGASCPDGTRLTGSP
jgi:hypothetical protein